ncbi:MAG: flippase-like domain-containing protein [Thermomicrobia bacterium]|nr:flippase-like domain-containing protein [Thermomicrobia bacterium]
MRRRILLLLAVVGGLIGMLVATGISIGPFNARDYLADIPRLPLTISIMLLFCTEIVKGARWGTFLQASGVRIRMRDAISTSMASQALTVLPGHDFLAARLVEEHSQGRYHPKMRQATPALVARWIADAIALSIVVTIGVAYYRSFTPYTLLPVPVALGIALLFRSKTPARWIARQLARWPRTRSLVRSEADFHRAARRVMRPRPLAVGVFYSIICTFLSAMILYTLTRGFGSVALSMPEALVTHSLSTLTAMVSFIPLGFGIADGSLAAWMHYFGVGAWHIVLVAMTMRLLNTVVRTAIGIATLLTRYQGMWQGSPRQLIARIFSGRPIFAPAATVIGALPASVESVEVA